VFDGFATEDVDTGEAVIHLRRGGDGPPVLLLHGYPQTHVMWHLVAPALARDFTVVAPDLRGYGDSSKPETTDDHEPYSKRAMARDGVALMARLGFERFAVAGQQALGQVVRLREEEPVPHRERLGPRRARVHLRRRDDVEDRDPRDAAGVVEGEPVGHPRAAVVAREVEAVEPELGHDGDHVARHRALGVRLVVLGRLRLR